ncbi:MAG: putative ABC transporter permease, partial [Atopobiaceae bacterium]|nr:putative ABC transporter permease [Atopobiaceae bacterium]
MWCVTYSVLGWVWESAYCTVRERTWENRGFLFGPACPIYGTGVAVGLACWEAALDAGVTPAWWQVFLLSMTGSAVLEYVTSWALERLFHARWWDYRDMPLNLNGRICLPASVLFGLAGLLVAYVLYQPTVDVTARLAPAAIEALSLMLMAVLAADTAVTASELTRFAQTASAIKRSVDAHMDKFVAEAVERHDAAAEELQERREEAEAALAEAREAAAHERERFAEELREA